MCLPFAGFAACRFYRIKSEKDKVDEKVKERKRERESCKSSKTGISTHIQRQIKHYRKNEKTS